MNKNHFPYLVVRGDKALAGADDRRGAEMIAAVFRDSVVKENSLVEVTGELTFDNSTVWFDDGSGAEFFAETLAKSLNVRPVTTRGNRANVEVGYVVITIKAANKPEEKATPLEQAEPMDMPEEGGQKWK